MTEPLKNLVPIADYAQQCGVSRTAIYSRKNIEITEVALPGGRTIKCVDVDKYPPQAFGKDRKPKAPQV